MKPRALISVTDKTGAVEFAKGLVDLGFEIVSTGGTARALREAGVAVMDVSEVTGFPEMLDGRVKTLHPLVHGGLLGDLRQESHRAAMLEAGIVPISILAVNLYAFEKTVTGDHDMEQAIESIDIGGPAMIRAASKNWANVAVVVDPGDYPRVLDATRTGTLADMRLKLSAKAFRHTAFYDSMISRYLTKAADEPALTETLTIGQRRSSALQCDGGTGKSVALYLDPLGSPGIAQARRLLGESPTAEQLVDADAAWESARKMKAGACVIVKGGAVCGAATGQTPEASCRSACKAAQNTAGAAMALNGPVDAATTAAVTEDGVGIQVVVGPSFTPEAIALFQGRSGCAVILLEARGTPAESDLEVRPIRGGWVVLAPAARH